MRISFLPFLITLLFFSSSCSHKEDPADHIYINAKIWTGDSSQPWAEAIAIKQNKIIYTGKEYEVYKGSSTIVTDLQGKLVVPGFIDNHTHFIGGGFQLASVNLRDAKSKPQFISILKQYSTSLTGNRWIVGGDWDHEAWGGNLPTKEWIDSVTALHPVFISRYDGHMALVNSVTLKMAGINRNTVSPAGGEIVRDPATGEPTGILRDEAMNLVYKVIPDPTKEEMEEALQRATGFAISFGVTQVHDMGSFGGWPDLQTYRDAYAKNKLGIRVYSFVPTRTWQRLDSFIKINGRGDDHLHWGGVKGFVDGSLGSTTAWFYKPYLDAPGKTGLQVTDTNLLRSWIIKADSAGIHCATHAIGDRANDFILDVYAEAARKNGDRDRRFRVEHAQHLTQAAIKNFALQHVIPSMQPYHAIDDGKWAFKRLDSARLKGTYAFKDLLQNGATVTFGTDWTVAPIDPLQGIYAAVTRRTLDDKNPGGWFPDQKLSVEAALRCYTINNAYAGFQEEKLGKLKAGMLADLVVLSDNIFEIDPVKIRDVKVLLTILDGKEVYKKQ